jgi:hypothetical protein
MKKQNSSLMFVAEYRPEQLHKYNAIIIVSDETNH